MTYPCEQKDNIKKLFDLHEKIEDRLHNAEIRDVEMASDVKHIRGRIDNGMSATISKVNETLLRLEPVIKRHTEVIEEIENNKIVAKSTHHSKIVGKIEDIGWWIAKIVIAALLLVLVWAIANGAHVSSVIK